MGDIIKAEKIAPLGKCVYRKWRYPNSQEHWYETYFVERVTPQYVFVRGFMEYNTIRLKRRVLEKLGYTVSTAHSAVFYTDMPEDYKKTTIGYLMAEEPREILGLRQDFTDEELHKAYRKLAMKYHPDRNPGDKDAEDRFKKVAAAYERLSERTTLGDIFKFMREQKDE